MTYLYWEITKNTVNIHRTGRKEKLACQKTTIKQSTCGLQE